VQEPRVWGTLARVGGIYIYIYVKKSTKIKFIGMFCVKFR
jgi:hypothetical protein